MLPATSCDFLLELEENSKILLSRVVKGEMYKHKQIMHFMNNWRGKRGRLYRLNGQGFRISFEYKCMHVFRGIE